MSNTVDTVVIGGSAGSLAEFRHILSRLPADLPATVLVCKHYAQGAGSNLVAILEQASKLRVVAAEDDQTLEPGTVVVATPDRHIMLGDTHIHLRRGAQENNFRPAIDPLFRSAAIYRGPRAIAVVLSGLLDDGTAGARALVRTGGRVLVRTPLHVEYPSMPRSVLAHVPEAEELGLDEIADRLVSWCGTAADRAKAVPVDIGIELKIAGLEGATMENEATLGTLSPYNCPHCNGVLWEIEDGPIIRFRCHTGHGYTMEALNAAQDEALDKGLFDALRAHKGRASLIRRLAERSRHAADRTMLMNRARSVEEDADMLEKIIRERSTNQ